PQPARQVERSAPQPSSRLLARIRATSSIGFAGGRWSAEPSDAAAIAGYLSRSDLRWDQPRIERVASQGSVAGHTHSPALKGDNLDIELLADCEINIPVLVEVPAEAFGDDVIAPGRNVAVERAAIFDCADIAAVHVDPREIKALRGFVGAVKPDPGLAR